MTVILKPEDFLVHDISKGTKKRCRSCDEILEIRCFDINNAFVDGWDSRCRECVESRHLPHKLLDLVGAILTPEEGDNVSKYTKEEFAFLVSNYHLPSTTIAEKLRKPIWSVKDKIKYLREAGIISSNIKTQEQDMEQKTWVDYKDERIKDVLKFNSLRCDFCETWKPKEEFPFERTPKHENVLLNSKTSICNECREKQDRALTDSIAKSRKEVLAAQQQNTVEIKLKPPVVEDPPPPKRVVLKSPTVPVIPLKIPERTLPKPVKVEIPEPVKEIPAASVEDGAPTPTTKFCPECQKTKGIGQFYFKPSEVDGRQKICMKCQNQRNQKQKESPVKKAQVLVVTSKTCCKCKVLKSLSAFNDNSHTEDGKDMICQTCKVGVKTYASGTKACVKCQNVKPLDDYHRNTASPDGRAYYCKVCKAKEDALRNQALNPKSNPAKAQELLRESRVCPKCENEFPLRQFYPKQMSKLSLARNLCQDCETQYHRDWSSKKKGIPVPEAKPVKSEVVKPVQTQGPPQQTNPSKSPCYILIWMNRNGEPNTQYREFLHKEDALAKYTILRREGGCKIRVLKAVPVPVEDSYNFVEE